jgi:hypothetical protein
VTATINIHGPFKFTATLIDADDSFVTVDVLAGDTKLQLMRVTREDCGALVKAALAARDLQPVPEPGEAGS